MSLAYRKDTRKILRAARRAGYSTRRTRRGHIQVSRDGRVVTVVPGTPSDRRWLISMKADLARDGFTWPQDTRRHNKQRGIQE